MVVFGVFWHDWHAMVNICKILLFLSYLSDRSETKQQKNWVFDCFQLKFNKVEEIIVSIITVLPLSTGFVEAKVWKFNHLYEYQVCSFNFVQKSQICHSLLLISHTNVQFVLLIISNESNLILHFTLNDVQ